MKTINSDRTCIVYSRGNFGVRVWKDGCQAVARDSEGAEWTGREQVHSLPVPDLSLAMPQSGLQTITALALEVAHPLQSESVELGKVLRGDFSFEKAIATQ